MSAAPSMPEGLPPGAIHLGTSTMVGSGQFVSGVLKLSNDPGDDLLDTANSFQMAADRCLTSCKAVPGVEMLIVPGVVCAALACELYLKFIHLKESGHSPHGHDLVELFTGLGGSTRTALAGLRSDIGQVLQRNRSHFTDARYHHEVAQFSFRQQELLQLAESLSAWVQARYRGIASRTDGS
jgi:HEPN domain-containing protein